MVHVGYVRGMPSRTSSKVLRIAQSAAHIGAACAIFLASGCGSSGPGAGAGGADASVRPPRMKELFGGCGEATDGSFWCFGPPVQEDVALQGALDVSWNSGVSIGTPDGFRCAVKPDRSVVCDGSDEGAQLGFDPSSVSTCGCGAFLGSPCSYPCQNTPRTVPGVSEAVRISADAGPCVVRTDGSVLCWGGWDSATGRPNAPRAIPLPDKATKIGGGSGSCALLANGTLTCWTLSSRGPIDQTTCPSAGCALPAVVPGLEMLVDLSISGEHGCALRADGVAFCWGMNLAGEVGDGTSMDRTVPAQVSGNLRFSQLSTNFGVTCAITQDARVACWGLAQTPAGVAGATRCDPSDPTSLMCRPVPTLVPGIQNARQVSAVSTGAPLAYVLLDDGSVIAIGEGARGFTLTQVAP